MAGRPKGGRNRYWFKDEKLKLVKEALAGEKSTLEISNGMFNNWIKRYLEKGEEGLINKKKPGNHLTKWKEMVKL